MGCMNLKVNSSSFLLPFLSKVIEKERVLYFCGIDYVWPLKQLFSHAALSVYISLLEEQHKYNDALELLSGNLGSLMMIEVDKLRLQVLFRIFSSGGPVHVLIAT